MAERKADKCLRLASMMLRGRKGVTSQMVEDQAFSMMEWEDENLDDTLERMSGDFLAEEEVPPSEELAPVAFDDDEMLPPPDETVYLEDDELDALLAEEEIPEAPTAGRHAEDIGVLASKVQALMDELEAMKRGGKKADQNDPNGPTLAPKPKSEEEARKEARRQAAMALRKAAEEEVEEVEETDKEEKKEEVAKEARRRAAWLRRVAEETDKEEKKEEVAKEARRRAAWAILKAAEEEVLEEVEESDKEASRHACMADDLSPEETALLAEMETSACGEMAGRKSEAPVEEKTPAVEEASMFAQSDEMGNPVNLTADDAILAEIFGGKVATKKSEEEPEEEPEEEESKEEPEEEESEEEEAPKESGKKAKKSDEDEVPEEEVPAKKASRVAAQRPQPRKTSTGISRVGSVTYQTAGTGEVAELSKLWETAPDVSDVFGNK
jgi:hypothetical protein